MYIVNQNNSLIMEFKGATLEKYAGAYQIIAIEGNGKSTIVFETTIQSIAEGRFKRLIKAFEDNQRVFSFGN